jgi:flagellar basal body-associated protein FliL
MKKTLIGPILSIIILLLLSAMLVYFFISLNKIDKKVGEIQTATASDSGKISAIVNFFNTNANAQATK